MVPFLKINNLAFELEQGFSDGYHNNLNPGTGLSWRTHPPLYYWQGGYFKPIKIQMNLAVGVQTIIPTPQDLVNTLATLESYALVENTQSGVKPACITLEVGTWFARKGYIEDVDFTYEPPWDIATGMPMKATVVLSIVSEFLDGVQEVNSALTPVADDIRKNKFIQRGKSFFQAIGISDPFASSL
jgi:hypothetical protein